MPQTFSLQIFCSCWYNIFSSIKLPWKIENLILEIWFNNQWCAPVISVKSELSQNYKPFRSESSQSHQKIFRVESETSHDLDETSQSRITRTVQSLRVNGLQDKVNVELNEISHFCDFFYYEMAPNML